MDTMTLSSKGQVSIPAKARRELGIGKGDKLAYTVIDGTLVIKPVRMPSEEEFAESLRQARAWASENNLTEADVDDAIRKARRERD